VAVFGTRPSGAQQISQLVDVRRFHEVLIEPRRARTAVVVFLSSAGERDEEDVGVIARGPNPA
jgi:hypothetical protein